MMVLKQGLSRLWQINLFYSVQFYSCFMTAALHTRAIQCFQLCPDSDKVLVVDLELRIFLKKFDWSIRLFKAFKPNVKVIPLTFSVSEKHQ